MAKEKPADTALRLSRYLANIQDDLNAMDDGAPNPFATALQVVALTVQAAIMNGKLVELASHCCVFIEKESLGENPFSGFDSPKSPDMN